MSLSSSQRQGDVSRRERSATEPVEMYPHSGIQLALKQKFSRPLGILDGRDLVSLPSIARADLQSLSHPTLGVVGYNHSLFDPKQTLHTFEIRLAKIMTRLFIAIADTHLLPCDQFIAHTDRLLPQLAIGAESARVLDLLLQRGSFIMESRQLRLSDDQITQALVDAEADPRFARFLDTPFRGVLEMIISDLESFPTFRGDKLSKLIQARTREEAPLLSNYLEVSGFIKRVADDRWSLSYTRFLTSDPVIPDFETLSTPSRRDLKELVYAYIMDEQRPIRMQSTPCSVLTSAGAAHAVPLDKEWSWVVPSAQALLRFTPYFVGRPVDLVVGELRERATIRETVLGRITALKHAQTNELSVGELAKFCGTTEGRLIELVESPDSGLCFKVSPDSKDILVADSSRSALEHSDGRLIIKETKGLGYVFKKSAPEVLILAKSLADPRVSDDDLAAFVMRSFPNCGGCKSLIPVYRSKPSLQSLRQPASTTNRKGRAAQRSAEEARALQKEALKAISNLLVSTPDSTATYLQIERSGVKGATNRFLRSVIDDHHLGGLLSLKGSRSNPKDPLRVVIRSGVTAIEVAGHIVDKCLIASKQ